MSYSRLNAAINRQLNEQLDEKFNSLLHEDPVSAIEQIGPRVYQLEGIEEVELRLITFGCQGEAGPNKDHFDQRRTAELMREIVNNSGNAKPHIIVLLGDNVYDNGVDSSNSAAFNTFFYHIYTDIMLKMLVNLGNHGAGRHAKSLINHDHAACKVKEAYQVAHTYIKNKRAHQLFQQDTLNYADLPKWSMPYFFYAIDIGNLRLFCLNSNSYAQDYLDLLENERMTQADKERNQAYWFKEKYDEAIRQGKTVYIAQHHPLITSGKRFHPKKFDSTHYLEQASINSLKKVLNLQSNSYNKLLAHIFKRQGITQVFCVLAAHDHFISYYNNVEATSPTFPLRQFTSGGGGGALQSRETFSHHPYVATHLKQHGIGLMSINTNNPEQLTIDIYTTEKLHLRFNGNHHHSIQCKPSKEELLSEDYKNLSKLKKCVLDVINNFFENMKQAEQTSSATDENIFSGGFVSNTKWLTHIAISMLTHDSKKDKRVEIAQHLAAYFQQYELKEFKTALIYLADTITELKSIPSTFELDKDMELDKNLEIAFEKTFGKSIESLKEAYGLEPANNLLYQIKM